MAPPANRERHNTAPIGRLPSMTTNEGLLRQTRVQSLDYLRGLMALAVMIYHYASWSIGDLGSGSVLGRLGIYAVSIFYILSGVSLALVYADRLQHGVDAFDFAVRRLFRIFPLFYVVVTSALLLGWASSTLHGTPYEFPTCKALLNYTLTFGFIDPAAYLSTGAWSIGNEIVFYTFFPLLFLNTKHAFRRVLFAGLLSLVAAGYFAFVALSNGASIELQWDRYINPLNQAFLFIAGVAIGTYLKPRGQLNSRIGCVMIVCLSLFCLWPASGNHIHLVTGFTRVILSAVCIALVASIFVWNPSFDSPVMKPLAFFGEGCYSIYLLHPIVAIPVVFAASRLHMISTITSYCIAFVVTLLLSWLSFRFIEKPMIRTGRAVSARLIQGLRTSSSAKCGPCP
jgi:peptidoglycan/LPS O-acetylase OafA/YrhL